MCGEQLGSPQHGDVAEQFGAYFVLAAFAASGLDVDRAEAHAVCKQGIERVVLIVRMRRSLHERAGYAQLPKRQAQRDMTAILGPKRSALCEEKDRADSEQKQAFHESKCIPVRAARAGSSGEKCLRLVSTGDPE